MSEVFWDPFLPHCQYISGIPFTVYPLDNQPFSVNTLRSQLNFFFLILFLRDVIKWEIDLCLTFKNDFAITGEEELAPINRKIVVNEMSRIFFKPSPE